MPDLSTLFTVEAGMIVAASVAILALVRKLWPGVARLKDFLDDFFGEPARGGVQRRPGVMEQLACLAKGQEELTQKVAAVDFNVKPNHGSSAHDQQARRIESVGEDLRELRTDVGELRAEVGKALGTAGWLMSELITNHPDTEIPDELKPD